MLHPSPSHRRPLALLLLLLVALLGMTARPAAALNTYVVTTAADDGSAGSLRDAITSANGNAGSTITFDPTVFTSGTLHIITLTSSLPALSAVTIRGPGASVVAVDGAGAYQPFTVNYGGPVAISGLTIQNGSAGNVEIGGGVLNDGTLTMTDCTLAANTAFSGGGVFNYGSLTLTDCTLAGNSAQSGGGGVYNARTLTLTGCTLEGNSAGGGGGVYNDTGHTVSLTGCTLTGNSAPSGSGGGVEDFQGNLTLTDDILYGDTAGSSSEVYVYGGSISATYSDIQGGYAGTGNINADPLFVSGSAPYDLHLQPGSPCLRAGTDEAASDHDGVLYGSPPTLGAYEILDQSDAGYQVVNLSDSGVGSLRAAVTYADANAATAITFMPGLSGTILLASALPALSAAVTITGPGANVVAVDGQNAVQPFSVYQGVTASLSGLTIQNGSAVDSGGFSNDGTLTLTGCTLEGNTAQYGGVCVNDGTLTLTGCTLEGNTAQYGGGGIFNYKGTLTLTGCTLEGNTAQDGGGGVLNFGTLTLTNCTLTGNSGSSHPGGAISNTNKLTLTNDVLYGDTAVSGSEVYVNVANGASATATGCDIQGGVPVGVTDNGSNLNADPLLSALGNYGGPTQTFALLPGSPCLGAGIAVPGVTQDQRGVAIPQSRRYDIGAFESQGFTLSAVGGSGQSTAVGQAFPNALTVTVTALDRAHLEPVVGGVLAVTAPPTTSPSATISAFTVGTGGAVSATATADAVAGSYTITASTRADTSGPASYALTNTLALTPSTLPAAQVGVGYSQTVTASGGTGPYAYAVTSGALPAGLALSTGGVLSGTPTAGGTFNFTLSATDSSTGPNTGSRGYTLTVGAATITLTPSTLPAATVGASYSQAVTAGGGTAPYSYAITAGALPAGLSLSAAGPLSGTPTASGTFNFTVTATDSSTGTGPYTGSRAYTLTVNKAATGTSLTSSLNPSFVGQSVTFTASVTGSSPTGSVTFTVDGTALSTGPVGLNGSGAASFQTSGLSVGSHVVTARYNGNANNAPSSQTLPQTVTNTVVTVADASAVYGQGATLTASLHGVGAVALPGRTLTFSVDGAVVGTAKTDGTSAATLRVTLGTTYAPGPHAITVSFGGDAGGTSPFHAASSGTGTLTVLQAGSVLTVPGVAASQGETATLRARLVRTPDHAALPEAMLSFSVDGSFAGTAATDGTGQAALNFPVPASLARGGHRITVTFSGTTAYGGCTATGTLSVISGGGGR